MCLLRKMIHFSFVWNWEQDSFLICVGLGNSISHFFELGNSISQLCRIRKFHLPFVLNCYHVG